MNYEKTLKPMLFRSTLLAAVCTAVTFGCAKAPEDDSSASTSPGSGKYLYVASGACQAGGNTTFTATTASNLVYRVNMTTGARETLIADYNIGLTGDTPVAITDYDTENLLVVVERNGFRRIEKVKKQYYGDRVDFSTDTAGALSAALIDITKNPSGGYFVSRTTGVALLGNAGNTQIATYLAANSGNATCGTTNIKYSSIGTTNFGHLIYMNAETNDNRIGVVSAGPTCLSGQVGPANSATAAQNATSTVLTWIPGTSQIVAAYAGTTVLSNINSLWVYDVTEDATTATVAAGTKIYDASNFPTTIDYRLYGVSAMTFDPDKSHLYVATSTVAATPLTSGSYVIERFVYDGANKTITRDGTAPFYSTGIDTRCISSMFIAN